LRRATNPAADVAWSVADTILVPDVDGVDKVIVVLHRDEMQRPHSTGFNLATKDYAACRFVTFVSCARRA
jgi:hypothetical protein